MVYYYRLDISNFRLDTSSFRLDISSFRHLYFYSLFSNYHSLMDAKCQGIIFFSSNHTCIFLTIFLYVSLEL